MKTKFTKGGWHYVYYPQINRYDIHDYPDHPADAGLRVLDCNHVGKNLAESNAKLIAAAPEMFDLLNTIENDSNMVP